MNAYPTGILEEGTLSVLKDTLAVLDRCMSLGGRTRTFELATPLLGSLPEFDSMAVVAIVTALEEQFAIEIQDDEISADTFETVGSVVRLVEEKLGANTT